MDDGAAAVQVVDPASALSTEDIHRVGLQSFGRDAIAAGVSRLIPHVVLGRRQVARVAGGIGGPVVERVVGVVAIAEPPGEVTHVPVQLDPGHVIIPVSAFGPAGKAVQIDACRLPEVLVLGPPIAAADSLQVLAGREGNLVGPRRGCQVAIKHAMACGDVEGPVDHRARARVLRRTAREGHPHSAVGTPRIIGNAVVGNPCPVVRIENELRFPVL